MIKKLILVTAILGIFSAWFFYSYAGVVGTTLIKRKDVKFQNEIAGIYNPEDKRELGYLTLVKAYTNLQILENYGYQVSPEKIDQEEKRIDATTQDKEKLNKVKAVFNGDTAAYRRVFIVPTFVNRTIYYDFYMNDESLHSDSQKMVESFLEDLKTKPEMNFSDEASKRNGQVQRMILSPEEGLHTDRKDRDLENLRKLSKKPKKGFKSSDTAEFLRRRNNDEYQAWLDTALKDIKVGQWIPQPVSRGPVWILLKLIEIDESSKSYVFEAALFNKKDFFQWREQEAQKVFVFPRPEIPN